MSQHNKIIAAVIAILVIAAGAFIASRPTEDASVAAVETAAPQAEIVEVEAPQPASNAGALETPNPMGEIVLGRADAPVTIVEYSSLTCPHCGAFHRDTLPKLKKQYIDSGQVKIYFRPFPFDPYATAGAMLAQCVAPAAQVNFLDVLLFCYLSFF